MSCFPQSKNTPLRRLCEALPRLAGGQSNPLVAAVQPPRRRPVSPRFSSFRQSNFCDSHSFCRSDFSDLDSDLSVHFHPHLMVPGVQPARFFRAAVSSFDGESGVMPRRYFLRTPCLSAAKGHFRSAQCDCDASLAVVAAPSARPGWRRQFEEERKRGGICVSIENETWSQRSCERARDDDVSAAHATTRRGSSRRVGCHHNLTLRERGETSDHRSVVLGAQGNPASRPRSPSGEGTCSGTYANVLGSGLGVWKSVAEADTLMRYVLIACSREKTQRAGVRRGAQDKARVGMRYLPVLVYVNPCLC